MKRDKETIYNYLAMKINPYCRSMTLEAITDLDGVLWDIADALCDKEPQVDEQNV